MAGRAGDRARGPALPPAAPTGLDPALRDAATRERRRADLAAAGLGPADLAGTVRAVRGAATVLDPSPDVRRRMRARVLATPAPAPARAPRRAPRRPAVAALALALLLGLLLAPAATARPGDAWFGLRQAGEGVLVDLAAATGDRLGTAAELAVADRRLGDLRDLAAGQDLAAAVDGVLAPVQAASRRATAAAVAGDVERLVVLHDWAVARAWELTGGPGGAARERVRGALLAVVGRTDDLALRLDCREITAGADVLGPRPAAAPCHPAGGGPPSSTPVDVDGLRAAG